MFEIQFYEAQNHEENQGLNNSTAPIGLTHSTM